MLPVTFGSQFQNEEMGFNNEHTKHESLPCKYLIKCYQDK